MTLPPAAKSWRKSDFFEQNKIIEEKEIENLIKEVKKCVEYYSQAVKVEPKGLEYWVQDYSPNDFHEIHNHGRTLFSVVYWVRASQTPGDLIIYEASEFKKNWFLKPSKVPFGYTNISITPKKGNLVVFPGYLNHEVLPGGKNCIRTTIAFNIT